MKATIQKELPLLAIIALPFIYLAFIWNALPAEVPVHWNIHGEIDRFGGKAELLFLPFVLPLLTYVLLLIIPKIDPKNRIKNMGNKYQTIKMVLTIFMSALALFIIYSAKNQSTGNPLHLILLIGVFYTILGNYFKTIKANYFIGIKTPWTLESEIVWNETHKMGGKMWFIGGLVVIISSFVLDKQPAFVLFAIVTGIITIVPVVYSYFSYAKNKKAA